MGALSRRKGHRFERELVHLFREAMPGAVVRRGIQARTGGECADIECPVLWLEAKRGQRPNVRAALAQAQAAAPAGRIPIAVIRDDRAEPLVALAHDSFTAFIGELRAALARGVASEVDGWPLFFPVKKRGKKPNVRAALDVALSKSPTDRLPLALIVDEGAEPFAVLRLDDFLEVVRTWWAVRPTPRG
jgi:hypothetical protein